MTVHGIDGPWSPARHLLRPGEFSECNFENDDGCSLKLPADRFDLVMSMEFVEHVSPERADVLAKFLASKGDALLISAAIPLQGGQHHVNERWPEYWAKKLGQFGFVPFDGLRLALWDRPEIDSWYRQNMILYFRNEIPPNVSDWGYRLALDALHQPRALVHPEFYAKKHGRLHYAVTNPLGFAQMLLKEAKSKNRAVPPIGNLARE